MAIPKIYTRSVQIRFHDADPAGIMYFANVFPLAHETFEEFITVAGIPWNQWFRKQSYIVPIRHTECNYLAPLLPGQKYEIQTEVATISDSSFQMQYSFKKGDTIHAIVKMVHTFVDSETKKKIEVPSEIRQVLTPYLCNTNAKADK